MPASSTAPAAIRLVAPEQPIRARHGGLNDRRVDGALAAANEGRGRLGDIQRARLLAAMVDVAAERGLADATVARVVGRAGVSRRTFYELFEDREQCFLAALDDAIARVTEYVAPAYRSGKGWLQQLRLALAALLGFLDADQRAGKLLIVGSLGAGPDAFERRAGALAAVTAFVDRGREQQGAAQDPPPLTAEGVVGGALAIVHARMVDGNLPLAALHGPLMSMIVAPYLGPITGRRELARPAPTPSTVAPRSGGQALRDLGMRLTYRTVRVLLHLAAQPDSSNRQVGDAVGISDQGQMSKLLARLHRLGLVENVGGPPAKGAPNAWRLTEHGREVERAMSVEGSSGR